MLGFEASEMCAMPRNPPLPSASAIRGSISSHHPSRKPFVKSVPPSARKPTTAACADHGEPIGLPGSGTQPEQRHRVQIGDRVLFAGLEGTRAPASHIEDVMQHFVPQVCRIALHQDDSLTDRERVGGSLWSLNRCLHD